MGNDGDGCEEKRREEKRCCELRVVIGVKRG